MSQEEKTEIEDDKKFDDDKKEEDNDNSEEEVIEEIEIEEEEEEDDEDKESESKNIPQENESSSQENTRKIKNNTFFNPVSDIININKNAKIVDINKIKSNDIKEIIKEDNKNKIKRKSSEEDEEDEINESLPNEEENNQLIKEKESIKFDDELSILNNPELQEILNKKEEEIGQFVHIQHNFNPLRNKRPDDQQKIFDTFLFTEPKYEYYNKKKEELEKLLVEREKEYERQLENFFGNLKRFQESYVEAIKTAKNEMNVTKVQKEKLTKEINFFAMKLSEAKDEINQYKQLIKNEKVKDKEMILSMLYNTDIIQKIKSQLFGLDLTQLPLFAKHLQMKKKDDDSYFLLKNEGGDYLKLLGSILYYLSQMKKRYISYKLEPIQENGAILKKAEPEVLVKIQNHLKVVYGEHSFIISFDTEYKKNVYTFGNLRDEICEMMSFPKEDFQNYYILEGIYVYSLSLPVYKTHLKYHQKHIYGEQEYIQMKNKIEILNYNINHKVQEKINVMNIAQEKNKFTCVNDKQEIFWTELEEYVKLYRTFEGVYLFFKHDQELEKMTNEYKKKIEQVNKNKIEMIEKNKKLEKEEENENVEWRAMEQIGRIGEQFEKDKEVYFNRKETPIYISEYSLYKYHLFKVGSFIFYTLFLLCLFYLSGKGGQNTINEMQKEDIYINKILFINPLYKHFFHVDSKDNNRDISSLIKTKKDILIWLNLIFNNLLFESDTEKSSFTNYYELYELFYGIKIEFKLNRDDDNDKEKVQDNNYNKFSEKLYEQFQFCENDLDDFYLNIQNCPLTINNLNFPNKNDICYDCPNNLVYYDIESQAYVFSLSNNIKNFRRTHFNAFLLAIKENLLVTSYLRELKLKFNLNHKLMQTIVKCDLKFTINSLGTVTTKLEKYVIDTTKNDSLLFGFITYFIEIVKYFFIVLTLFNIFAYFVKHKRLKLEIFSLVFDLFISSFLVASYVLSLEKYENNKQLTNIKITSFDEASAQQFNLFEYKDYQKIITQRNQSTQIDAILILVFFIRDVFLLRTSPIINLIFQVIKTSFKNSFKLIVITCLMVFCFSLVLHSSLGALDETYNNLGDCLIKSVIALFGIFDTHNIKKYMTLYQYIFIIGFMIVNKFFIIVFVFPMIYHSFIQVYTKYSKFKKNFVYKIVGDNLNEFIMNLLVPFNFYFIIKKLCKLRKIFIEIDLEKSIDTFDENKQIVYQKIDIEERDVYYFYIEKK